MTGETGASIGPYILEERIVSRTCGTTRLEGRDPPGWVGVDTKFWNDAWRRLWTTVGIFVSAHLLRVIDCSRCEFAGFRRVVVAGILRRRGPWQAAQETDRRNSHG
jgi:hypothetical protein